MPIDLVEGKPRRGYIMSTFICLAIQVRGVWHRLPPMTPREAWEYAAKSRLQVFI